jgi:flagellar biosynthesis protein FlhB
MESSSQDRNLPASERKLKKTRDEGQVARSQDLSHLAVLGAGALALMVLAPMMFEQLQLSLSQQLRFNASALSHPEQMLSRLQAMATTGFVGCVVFSALIAVAAIFSALVSGGWVFSLKPVLPDFSRISPLQGLGNLFSKKKLAEVVKMTVVTLILIAIATRYLSTHLATLATLILQPSVMALHTLSDWLTQGLGLLLLVIIGVALLDVPLQGFLHRSKLKMSRQEMKDEHKESEGNEHIKRQRRAKQSEISQRRSVRAVPKADFILMNPTHYAVAVQYNDKSMAAPRLIAKGADLIALKIRDIAKAHAIPVIESPALARALFTHAELDQDIPTSLYTAVAQVLAYVYRLEAALRGEAAMPDQVPVPNVPPELDPLSPVVMAH